MDGPGHGTGSSVGDPPGPVIAVFAEARWVLRLPVHWAAAVATPQVCFTRHDRFGWQVYVDDGGERPVAVATFPWYDDVDDLVRRGTGRLPPLPTGPGAAGQWHDLEQGWWLTVTEWGDDVHIALASFDGVCDEMRLPTPPEPQPVSPGIVRLGAQTIRWSRVPTQVWSESWRRALIDLLARSG